MPGFAGYRVRAGATSRLRGGVGVAALAANGASFALLWRHRGGDANMRSAWICTRNDVLGNLAVLAAAAGVFGAGSGWPDLVVATAMATLALQGAAVVLRQARRELRGDPVAQARTHGHSTLTPPARRTDPGRGAGAGAYCGTARR